MVLTMPAQNTILLLRISSTIEGRFFLFINVKKKIQTISIRENKQTDKDYDIKIVLKNDCTSLYFDQLCTFLHFGRPYLRLDSKIYILHVLRVFKSFARLIH